MLKKNQVLWSYVIVFYVNFKYNAAGKTGTSESFIDTDNDGNAKVKFRLNDSITFCISLISFHHFLEFYIRKGFCSIYIIIPFYTNKKTINSYYVDINVCLNSHN